MDGRTQLAAVAAWCVAHQPEFVYLETRPFGFDWTAPIVCDCSATVTRIYHKVACPDPNGPGFNYNGYGNTDSLATNGREVATMQPGDLCIFYENGGTVHVSMAVESGADPQCMSHGQQSEPAFVRPSVDGRAHKFFTYDTTIPDPVVAIVPGSLASKVDRAYLPPGDPPTLTPGAENAVKWVRYFRWCMMAGHYGPVVGHFPGGPNAGGGYGSLTQNAGIRWVRAENETHPSAPLVTDAVIGDAKWTRIGVINAGGG